MFFRIVIELEIAIAIERACPNQTNVCVAKPY